MLLHFVPKASLILDCCSLSNRHCAAIGGILSGARAFRALIYQCSYACSYLGPAVLLQLYRWISDSRELELVRLLSIRILFTGEAASAREARFDFVNDSFKVCCSRALLL